MKTTRRKVSRRQFVAAGGVGLAATCGALALWIDGKQRRRSTVRYEYDLEAATQVDPEWLQYEEMARFTVPLTHPRRLVVGPQGRMLVASEKKVGILGLGGELEAEISTSMTPRCLAVTEDELIFVAGGRQIEAYSIDGTRLISWEPLEQRSFITGLAPRGEELFLADAGNRVIVHCDRQGREIGRIGEPNAEQEIDGFIVPSPCFDVKLGYDGLLRAANPGRHRIEVYTPAGGLEMVWGKAGFAVGRFAGCCNPAHLAVFSDGRVVTFEKGLPRVTLYRPDGELEAVVAPPQAFPENLQSRRTIDPNEWRTLALDGAIDSLGRIYILDPISSRVQIMKPKANRVA